MQPRQREGLQAGHANPLHWLTANMSVATTAWSHTCTS